MAKVPRDPEALRQAIAAAMGIAPTGCGSGAAIDTYIYALGSSWKRMQVVVGEEGARAIMQHAVKVASRHCEQMSLVSFSDQGPDLSRLNSARSEIGDREYCLCLGELYLATLQTLVELTGEVLAGPLLDEMRERNPER